MDYNPIAASFSKTRSTPWKDWDLFLPFLPQNFSALDLGCGNGRLLPYLKKHGLVDYLGVDLSEALLKEARKIHPDGNFIQGDMSRSLNIPENTSFDLIFAIASFHHLQKDEQIKALNLWKKYLKPSGHLCMTNWNLHQRRFLPELLKQGLKKRSRMLEISWQNQYIRYYFAFTLKRLKSLLKEAGFTLILNEYTLHGEKASWLSGFNLLTIARYEGH